MVTRMMSKDTYAVREKRRSDGFAFLCNQFLALPVKNYFIRFGDAQNWVLLDPEICHCVPFGNGMSLAETADSA